MASRPSTYLNWTDGSGTKITQPPSAQLLSGWTAGQPIPFQYLNWLFYETDQWIQYLDQTINDDSVIANASQIMRLINGGVWSWVASTGTLAWSLAFNLAIPSIADADNQAAAGNIALSDGQIAYVTANLPFSTTGNITNTSNQLTGLAFTTGIVVGQTITGTGIPGSTTVSSISGNTVTMSANATATTTALNVTFSGVGALTVAAATSSTFIASSNTIVIARRVGAICYVGVNAAQMVLRDAENKNLLYEGYDQIFTATAGQNLNAGQAVYISTGAGVDSGRTAGDAYLVDTGVTNGVNRNVLCGFVMTTVLSGATVTIIGSGLVNGFSSLTVGVPYYCDPANPGGITSTVPTTTSQFITLAGLAISATQILCPGASPNTQVLTPNAWPNYFVSTEAQLSTAITNASSGGGGVICLLQSFTITSAHTIPANTVLQGRGGATILTLSSSGALTLADFACMRDVFLTTALSSGNMLSLPNNYSKVRDCQFTCPTTSTVNCINVTGNANRMYNNVFVGVAGDTGEPYGINYAAGVDNLDDSSVFLP